MREPRPEKAAVVVEVRQRLTDANAALLTEYRSLNVAAMAELRQSLRSAGGEYKVYKNTLVRRACMELDLDLGDMLTGPTAIAFVGAPAEGPPADATAVAKALRDFARRNPTLVVKGGVLDGAVIGADEVTALAEMPPRQVMLAHVAAALAAPMTKAAGLLQALPRKFAYALNALIDKAESQQN